ncbi:MAG: hypothetical protein COB76_04955 [Alphaproteobacteria bacterium]|nr:MAG: hypothetical protein COB76_04955 [Alphaproteobacteria bacterium]
MKRALILLLVLGAAIVTMRTLPVIEWAAAVTDGLRSQGVLGGIGYIIGYAILASLFVPGSLLTMLAGATWGMGFGLLIIVPAATLATAISAFLGRTMLRDLALKLTTRYPLLNALDRAFGERALRFVTLLRLSPIMPFAPSNYALGSTSAPLLSITAGTFVGIIPITAVWLHLGILAGDAVLGGEIPDSPYHAVMLVGGLAVTVLIVVWIGRRAKGLLEETP